MFYIIVVFQLVTGFRLFEAGLLSAQCIYLLNLSFGKRGPRLLALDFLEFSRVNFDLLYYYF